MKIGSKLVTTFLLVALLPLAAGGVVFYLHVQTALSRQAFKQLESVASIQTNRLESLLAQNLERLSLIASRTQLRLSLAAWIKAGEAQHLSKMHKILNDAKNAIEDIRAIFILDLQGKVIVSTTPDWIGRDDSTQEYFLSGRHDSRSDLLTLDPSGKLGLHLSGPLMLGGKALGVVVVDLAADTLLSMTADYSGLGTSGETLLAGLLGDGNVYYLTPLRFDPSAGLRRRAGVENPKSPVILASQGQHQSALEMLDYRGVHALAVTRHLPSADWGLVVKIDRDEALEPVARLRQFIVAGLVLLALTIVLTSIRMAHVIGRPVELIAGVAERIGRGERETELGRRLADAPSEIISLGQSIERMSRSLEEQQRINEQAEQTLRRNEWFLDAIVENIPDMIFVKDAEQLRFIRLNRAGEELLGYSRDELIGKSDHDFFPRPEADFFVAKDREVLNNCMLQDIPEEPIETRERGLRLLHTKKIPILDDTGEPIFLLGISQDITEQKEYQKKLEHIAHYDTLTDLPNRVLLVDRLKQAMAQEKRRQQQLAVVYLDLDGFKEINDRHGHEIGDRFLAALAGRFRQSLRQGDTIARLGGDEFVAVLLDIGDSADYVPLLKRLLQSASLPVHLESRILQASASLGVALYPQTEEVDADQLLRQSDQAMYQAKLAGKNGYHVFDTAQDRHLRGRRESLERIREGLEQGEFLLHYQPKVNMGSGELIGVEALIRWQHPEQGLLPPIHFLPVVEDHPLAETLDEWVLDAALTQMEAWKSQGLDIGMSINIGARMLQSPDFVRRLEERLSAHPEVEPGSLELEILETSALEDLYQVSGIIRACKEMGVSFALDDFGTGYSSLAYLKHLPAASLKIDRAFVRDMLEDPDDLAILEGILGMSAAFRRQVIAEGVESREHGELLLQLGCELGQGFGIARPMPAEQLPEWIVQWRPYPSWLKQTRISRDDLSLLFAAIELRAWVHTLGAFLGGQRDQPPPLEPPGCRFCLWLNDEGKRRYGDSDTFASILSLHDRIHDTAQRLCRHQDRYTADEPAKTLPHLHRLRDELVAGLLSLQGHE